MRRILIAEDEPRIAAFVDRGLRANGFTTAIADDGAEALAMASSGDFDLLILDLGLPGQDGLTVLRTLRDEGRELPVVILTGRHTSEEGVAGLDGGADDFIGKPFRFEELLARIQARLPEADCSEPVVLRTGRAALDMRARTLIVGPRTVPLTAREFALAEAFFRHPGEVLTPEQLLGKGGWGYENDTGANVVDVYVRHLGAKLGDDLLTTVPGIGYRLEGDRGP